MGTTNYYNTFIEVADDCPAKRAEIPLVKEGVRTAANIQFEMISRNPYAYSSDDVLFKVFADKNQVADNARISEREKFFLKGQACLRSSPLTKRYGWGVHSNAEGKIAIFAVESDEYKNFLHDKGMGHVKAMRSKRVR